MHGMGMIGVRRVDGETMQVVQGHHRLMAGLVGGRKVPVRDVETGEVMCIREVDGQLVKMDDSGGVYETRAALAIMKAMRSR